MQMHGFSPRTHESDLAAVRDLAKFTRRSPDTLAHADLTRYFEHLVRQRGLARPACACSTTAFASSILTCSAGRRWTWRLTLPKRPQRIPELLTRGAVAAILAACDNARYRTMLTVCYGCGLRLSEVLALRVKDIDGEHRLLRITQGKGAKDRLVPFHRPCWRRCGTIGACIALRSGSSPAARRTARAHVLAEGLHQRQAGPASPPSAGFMVCATPMPPINS